MKTNLIKLTCGMALLGAAATATAQSTWNYFISDGGGGNSLVTWNVTGSFARPPGVVWDYAPFTGFGAVQISAPGLYVDSYVGTPFPQTIPTLDGSYVHDTELNQNDPFNMYYTDNASGSGNDSFAILISATTHYGDHLTYYAGTQSVLIPVPFSDFNPGTYQTSYAAGTFFDTAATANLTVGSVPEPTTLTARLVASNIACSWPTNAAGFTLQFSTNLQAGIWSDVTNSAVIAGTNYCVTLSADKTESVFRLKK